MKENRNPMFDKFRKKLIAEAWLKSFMFGVSIAGAVSAVIALVLWFTAVSGVWYAVGTLVGLTAALMPLFYFLRYRPDDMDIARRLDRMGLDERMITMTEFGNATDENSVMLARQHDDAVNALGTAVSSGKKLSIAISGLAVIPVVCALALSGGMITVNALSDAEVIPGGNQVIESIISAEDEKFFTVQYKVLGIEYATGELFEDEGGYIDGNDEQLVVVGGSATPVIAAAEDDWLFYCWDLDVTQLDPYREDIDITIDGTNTSFDEDGNYVITHTAYFILLPEGSDDSDADGDGENGENADQDAPKDQPSEGDDDSQNTGSSEAGDGEEGEEGGGTYSSEKDNIIDGNQDYRGVYEQYLQEALEIINNGGELPEYYKKLIEDYFGIIV